MNAKIPRTQVLAVLGIAVVVLMLATPAAPAADSTAALCAVLPAFGMSDIVLDRSRLIQFSMVAVAIGIAILWWGQKS